MQRTYPRASFVALQCCVLAYLMRHALVLAQTPCVHHQGGGGDDDGNDGDGNWSASSWTHSFCSSTASAGATGATRGSNADISANGTHLGGGSIAGIVVGLLAFLALVLLLAFFLRRRYARGRNPSRRTWLPGPGARNANTSAGVGALGAAQFGAKGGGAMAMANAPPRQSVVQHAGFLPPLPFDSPPYTSTDNLTSERAATFLTYASPSEATAGHGPRASLHEDMVAHQKELETGYRMMEGGEESGVGAPGPGNQANAGVAPGPPPQYMG